MSTNQTIGNILPIFKFKYQLELKSQTTLYCLVLYYRYLCMDYIAKKQITYETMQYKAAMPRVFNLITANRNSTEI